MQHPGRFTHIAACRGKQRGQANAEYLVVTTALIAILLVAVGDDVSPLVALIAGLKSFFSAYSFTLSLP